jgi:hypothetical protein
LQFGVMTLSTLEKSRTLVKQNGHKRQENYEL